MFVSNLKSQNLRSAYRGMVIALGCCVLGCVMTVNSASAQVNGYETYQTYKLVPVTVYEKKPVTMSRWINETTKERKQETAYKQITQTEQRERKHVTYKPIRTTSEREERMVVKKPITETLFRERRTEETTFEEVTDYRDEEYTVREPVIETEMREEKYTVRKPVTQKLIEVKSTTTYKPKYKNQTELVPTTTVVPQIVATPDPTQRPRMTWLGTGYYTDPASGQTVYRRRGLHWVQPSVLTPAASTVPTLVPRETGKFEFVPETVEERTPIEVTRMVEKVETRKVPVEVKRMVERTKTRRVPYARKVPKTVVTTEEIPYTRTTYREEVVVKKVPYEEVIYQKVETFEPYEVETSRWVPYQREVEVPRTVSKRVDYEVMQTVPRTIMMKVPIDCFGNEIGDPVLLDQAPILDAVPNPAASNISEGFGTTLTRKVTPLVGESEISDPADRRRNYKGTLSIEKPTKVIDETSKSIMVKDRDLGENLAPIVRPFGGGSPNAFGGANDQPQAGRRTVEVEDVPEVGETKTLVETSRQDNVDPFATDEIPENVPTKSDPFAKVEMPENVPTESGNENAEMRSQLKNDSSDDYVDPPRGEDDESEADDNSPGLNGPSK